MKNKKYPIWSAVSVVTSIVFFVALVPLLTIGFADRSTQISYFIILTLLFIFTFVSLFLTVHYKGKVAPNNTTQVEKVSRKLNRQVIVAILIIILILVALSIWNSLS